MTAKGKITTSEIGRRPMGTVRILITDDGRGHRASDAAISGSEVDTWYPAYNKTGMVTATVTGVEAVRGNRRSRYYLTTDRGKVNNLSPSQTFWLAPEPAAPADSKDKTLGEMTPAERADTVRRAAARMQAELTSNAPAISAALESVDQPAPDRTDPQSSYTTVPNRARGVQADTTLSGTVPAGFTGSTLVVAASSGQPTVVAYVEHGDVSDKATPVDSVAEQPDEFDPAAVRIERHRPSVTQGEVSVFYRSELLGRYRDDVQLCTGGSNGHEPHPHADGASCFGGFHGLGDRYWVYQVAAAQVAERARPVGSDGCGGWVHTDGKTYLHDPATSAYKRFDEMTPGDVIAWAGRPAVEVLRVGEPYTETPGPLAGREHHAHWCRRLDNGQEGYVPYGPGGEAPVRHGATVEAPPGPPTPGETFEQQTSENGGKTWRTTATGLDAADIAATRDRDATGEGVRWRALPETDNSLARLIAAKEAELVAARNATEANFNRPVGGSSRTKQFGRRIDAQLRRGGQLGREVQRLQSEIRGLRRRATEPAPAPLDLSRLPYAKAIRTATGWYRVLKVNAKSVVVEVPPGWDNRFPLSRILEIRERDDAPAPAVESVGFDGTVISGPHTPRGSARTCDVGGEQLDGPWYLISAGPAGDRTADRGASCAEHCGRPAPDAAATLTPGPLTSVPAAFVSSWGNVRADA
jgi:hypothetical protein